MKPSCSPTMLVFFLGIISLFVLRTTACAVGEVELVDYNQCAVLCSVDANCTRAIAMHVRGHSTIEKLHNIQHGNYISLSTTILTADGFRRIKHIPYMFFFRRWHTTSSRMFCAPNQQRIDSNLDWYVCYFVRLCHRVL